MPFKTDRLSSVVILAIIVLSAISIAAQDRPRIISTVSSRPINAPAPPAQDPLARPRVVSTLSQQAAIRAAAEPANLIKKTAMSAPAASTMLAAGRTAYTPGISSMILNGIQSRYGIPYLYGSSGPNRYDCSGFVWSVFKDAGISFERMSARSLWSMSIPVEGAEKYKFGTLVFLNNLGHMGIVADENGFYHASSSKGITYSPFKGYWESRIVGFRKLPVATPDLYEPEFAR